MKRLTLHAGLISAFALAALTSGTAIAAQPQGLAYDEITKIVIGQSMPEPGTFAVDFQTASDAIKSASSQKHHGLFGGIMNTIDSAKNAMNMFKNGVPSTKYYLGAWQRADDLSTQTATITKPAQPEVYLNLAKKTYRVAEAGVAAQLPAPTTESPQSAAGEPSKPGSGVLDITVSSSSLGSRTIDSIPTTGYKMVLNLTESKSTGSCKDGTFQTTITEYVSSYVQPHGPAAASQGAAARFSHPEMMALQPGCAPTIKMHTIGGAHPPADRLPIWMLVTVSGNAPSAQGQMQGGFSVLMERGNVRTIGAADKPLFSIPADFTKE